MILENKDHGDVFLSMKIGKLAECAQLVLLPHVCVTKQQHFLSDLPTWKTNS